MRTAEGSNLPTYQAIAYDRWDGLMLSTANPEAPSELSDRLTAVLTELISGMTRQPVTDDRYLGRLLDDLEERLVFLAGIGEYPEP